MIDAESETQMLIVAGLDGDIETPMVFVTAPMSDVPNGIKVFVGVGNPYYAFETLPFDYSNGILADFSGAPVCSNTRSDNLANINTMLGNPTAYLAKVSVA